MRALASQVELMPDNVMENIKEMTILCREWLNSDASDILLATDAFATLYYSMFKVMGRHLDARRELDDQVIECFREANIRFPYSPPLSYFLGRLLTCRFFENGVANDGDYNEAIASLNRAITLASDLPEDTEDYRRIIKYCLWGIATYSRFRYAVFGKSEYLEEAINHSRTYLSSSCIRKNLTC
jgi:hypothetical protein